MPVPLDPLAELRAKLMTIVRPNGGTLQEVDHRRSQQAAPASDAPPASQGPHYGASLGVSPPNDLEDLAGATSQAAATSQPRAHQDTNVDIDCASTRASRPKSPIHSTQVKRGEHRSLPNGRYEPQEPVSSKKRSTLHKEPFVAGLDLLPGEARQDVRLFTNSRQVLRYGEQSPGAACLCHAPLANAAQIRHITEMFAYTAYIERDDAGHNMFKVTFIAEDQPAKDSLPPQAIQRVYLQHDSSVAVVVTMTLPLSAPLAWKTSQKSERSWTLLEEVIHCPDPDRFPMQHRMWRLFHDQRRQTLVRDYLALHSENIDAPEHGQTFLGDCAEQVLYMFDIGRPPRVWTVGGEGSVAAGFSKVCQSSFGSCMWTYEEADILLLNEAEHVIWAANEDNAPRNILLFDEGFNCRRPGKSTARWLEELRIQEKMFPEAEMDVQLLRLCKWNRREVGHTGEVEMGDAGNEDNSEEEEEGGEPNRAAHSLPLKEALAEYEGFRPEEPISLKNCPTNYLNITDEQIGYWPEGLAKSYTLLRELIQHTDSRSYDGPKDAVGKIVLGKPKAVWAVQTPSDVRKSQQFRIFGRRGAASDWHMDQNGVYTFVHLEANSDEDTESADDVVKYWPSYPLDHLSGEEQRAAREQFASGENRWRPRPAAGIPVLTILKGYMLLQKPGNIHAPITLTDCLFLGGMAWKHSSLRMHLEVMRFLAENQDCTNEELSSEIQRILLTLRRMIEVNPEPLRFSTDGAEIEEFDKTLLLLYGMVSSCDCQGQCISETCRCRRQNAKCGNRCHIKVSKTKCANVDQVYEQLKKGRALVRRGG